MHARLAFQRTRPCLLPPSSRGFASSSRLRIPISNRPSGDDAHKTKVDDAQSQSPKASEGSQAHPPPSSETEQSSGLNKFDLEALKARVREWAENTAITFRGRANDFTASASSHFSQLGGQLNRVTGYDEIDALKKNVVEQEARILKAREAAREAKTAHEEAVIQRANSQREVNELLSRKSTWHDDDVSRFTTLVREDHLYEQTEARTKSEALRAEERVDKEFSELMRCILARYHEEQVWSDKIRSASTYGQLAALGLNLVVFVLAIVVVEPWKRRRLAQTFESKITRMSEENRDMIEGGMNDLKKHFENQEAVLAMIAERALALKGEPERTTLKLAEPEHREGVEQGGEEVEVVVSEIEIPADGSVDKRLASVVAATAMAAGFAGWLVGSWYGR